MSDLQPYNPDARCPKCDYDSVTTRYMQEITGAQWAPFGYLAFEPRPEHLQRECVRCGHRWREAVVERPIVVREIVAPDEEDVE